MKITISFFVFPILVLVGCQSNPENDTYNFSGEAQGTTYTISYYADQKDRKEGVDSILRLFDQDLSLWVENSLINRFNRFERIDTVFSFYDSTKYMSVTYEIAREVFRQTEGAFDPTVYPLVKAWGFGPDQKRDTPPSNLDSLTRLVGFGHQNCDLMEIVEDYVYQVSWLSKGQPGVMIDFNGIAQGAAVDFIAEYLWREGINDFMIELGGEVYCAGLNKAGQPWQIAIDQPLANGERAIQEIVGVSNAGIATSGSYRSFYEKDSKRFSHTIDPKSGYPVEHNLLSATVVASDAAHADAYATALMVMGPEKSKAFLSEPPTEIKAAYLIYEEQGKLSTWMTESMQALITKPQP